MRKYSFIEHPVYTQFRTLTNLVPNVKKAYALFSDNRRNLNFYAFEEKTALDTRNRKHLLQKFRAEKKNTAWVRLDMLEFLGLEKKKRKIQQLSLIDENENNLLCLKFHSPYDDLYDVILIELTQSSLLQFVKEGKELTTSQKTLIEVLLYNNIKSNIESEYENLKTHALIVDNFKSQQEKIKNSLEENERIKKHYDQTFNYFLNTIATKVKIEFELELNYSPTCVEYISNLDFDLEIIEKSILQSVNVYQNLNLEQDKSLTLEPENIQIIEPKKKEEPIKFVNKHQNIIDILDRYEAAAIALQEKGMKVNGANVAQACIPTITPAAISFNLKKYAATIIMLTEKYDNKWSIIKNQFKPLINIIEKTHKKIDSKTA